MNTIWKVVMTAIGVVYYGLVWPFTCGLPLCVRKIRGRS